MYCSACGKKCPDGAVYCAWCGSKLPELAAAQAGAEAGAEAAVEAAEEIAPASPAAGDGPSGGAGEAGAAEPPALSEQLDLDLDAPPEEPEPEKGEDPAHRAFRRPRAIHARADDAQTVRPLAANPAQPLRGAEAEAAAAAAESEPEQPPEEPDDVGGLEDPDVEDGPDLADAPAPKAGRRARARDEFDDEWVRPAKDRAARGGQREAKPFRFGRGGERPAKRSPYDREDERPAKHAPFDREDERPAKRAPFDPDGDLPPRAARAKADRSKPQGSARGKAVTASGGMVTPPARRPPAKPSGLFRPQAKRPRKDLFFEDLEMPAENFYDEAAEERALARRIKAVVSIALAAGALMVAVWLMWTPGGQIVRAQLNLGAPASAYKALGDQDRAGGQVQRAADAYHDALRLDPKNYEYAMLVGKTKEMIGDRDAADAAYRICVGLKPAAVEPYVRLKELWKVKGDDQMAENWRAEGYAKTGDATLAPGT